MAPPTSPPEHPQVLAPARQPFKARIAPAPGRTTQNAVLRLRMIKDDGSVITWGLSSHGGDSSSVSSRPPPASLNSSPPTAPSRHSKTTAPSSPGETSTGGNSSSVSSQLSSGVAQLFSTGFAFAALKDDGSVITWGSSSYGGDSSSVSSQLSSGVNSTLLHKRRFAAVQDDGSVITWGSSSSGGDSSSVSGQLGSASLALLHIHAFAAPKTTAPSSPGALLRR